LLLALLSAAFLLVAFFLISILPLLLYRSGLTAR
jgi:hypothetical protein